MSSDLKFAFDFEPPPLDKDGMPEWVPVLTARDMCKGDLNKGERHCAYGWQEVLRIPDEVFTAAYWEANNCDNDWGMVTAHNDDVCRTNRQRAAAMNRAFAALGYDVEGAR